MRFEALASDYDGTLAEDGRVDELTIAAVKRLRASGRKFILVTGRRMDDLATVFSQMELCDLIVGENGAVLYWPALKRTEVLGSAPPQNFLQALYTKGVPPLAVGQVIVAMLASQAHEVEALILEHGLDLRMIFNKDNLMILPKGIDKATGLASALSLLGLSSATTIAVGDAENDEPLLAFCGAGVAVANAVPELKAGATLILEKERGAGVCQLIDDLLNDHLPSFLLNR